MKTRSEERYLERERGRHKRQRRRRSSDYYDDDEDSGGISGWKLGLVIGVIVVCFAMLYPTLFHPMLMGFLGRNQSPKPSINQQRPPMHPAMGGGGRHQSPPGAGRADVHPAMRMAQAQVDTGSSGGKGMFTWALPFYTIIVVAFLLYTLFKSKTKPKKKRGRRGYDSEYEDEDDEEDSEVDTRYGEKFGKKKLKGLQERLRQTEEAMSKILEQLEAVQAGAAPIDLDNAEKVAAELEETVSEDNDVGDKVAKKEAVGLTDKNEQYINDLERALRDFQVLSKEYDKAKLKKMRNDVDEESSEEESESQSESSVDETHNKKKAKKSSKPAKKQKRSTSEEEDEDEKIKEEENEDIEEEGIDIDAELREQKTVRRRRPKKT